MHATVVFNVKDMVSETLIVQLYSVSQKILDPLLHLQTTFLNIGKCQQFLVRSIFKESPMFAYVASL